MNAPTIDLHGFPLNATETRALVRAALEEDRAFDDVTTLATIPATATARALLAARREGVACGIALAEAAFAQFEQVRTVRRCADGARLAAGDVLLEITGPARAILQAERVALNYAMRLSGVATLTQRFVDAVAGTGTAILDTRKTTPGWRDLEKYAVRCGGGRNHRRDLASMALIKDNHLAAVGGDIAHAVAAARALLPAGAKVEVECDRFAQVERAVAAGADVIMLDNMPLGELRRCVAFIAGRALVEASGGVTLDTVRAIAETGVDWISVGALTHSAPALDLGLDFG
jgi:nicotinate-nucleotide pyrophosphorylase (carboxylating)